ncbi:hypothetical protein E8E13_010426 [Curvularia kusanoi]|uniref:BTB domain-containing protein n=1 Tax=Curvularia kusanoi TaxID=90978 RepID=A0A9P4WA70_CURKU|nr:hypothetical protein E8E13_010426 [Curvularia kusanoi]
MAQAVTSSSSNQRSDPVTIEVGVGTDLRRFILDSSYLTLRSRYLRKIISKRNGRAILFQGCESRTFRSYLRYVSCRRFEEETSHSSHRKKAMLPFIPKNRPSRRLAYNPVTEKQISENIEPPLELAKIYVFVEKVEDSGIKLIVIYRLFRSLRLLLQRDPRKSTWDPPDNELVKYVWSKTEPGSPIRKLFLKIFARLVGDHVDYNTFPAPFVVALLKTMVKIRGDPTFDHVLEANYTIDWMRYLDGEKMWEEEEEVADQVA